jgi:hypothetical protein
MSTRRYGKVRSNKSKTRRGGRKGGSYGGSYGGKPGKKWTTAIDAAKGTLKKTGSLKAANSTLKKQALSNARKLFGSI